ncbi:CoA pyrophosphatase [Brevundimonas sp.]|uniref:CoA pyrophosphatase n=1 Tax=Brevundimonas sp. TaxID=1871086 RepID=UPI001DFD0CD4|nr:CoA pyrophosphatase [Brevundimonas sp.]MBL0948444.1 CoA pyrophosphatase [Brevundimonas sp.]
MTDAARLKARLVRALDPADGTAGAVAARSDFDLNPGAERPARQLRPAAVLILIIAEGKEPRVLMTRRSDSLASHTGQIAFPGGRLDPGETVVEAALREAREEVALAVEGIDVLGLADRYETGTGFLVTPVVAWTTDSPRTEPNPDEVAEVFEVPWAFLMNAANHRQDHYELEGQPRRYFWAMPYGERYIWGVTAGILRALHDRMDAREGEAAA